MKLSAQEFKNWENKAITLLGMSGVGKTYISNILRSSDWFHYSGDYRIGTRYLDEPIIDNIKQKAMEVPFLRDLLRSDSIYIKNNITFDHLDAVSSYLGKLGNPELNGLSLEEFKHRQDLFHKAEIATMLDMPSFLDKAKNIYGFNHFVNDAGGSLCEIEDENVFNILQEHTVVIYIKASKADEKRLIDRAVSSPKPLYYREAFLDEKLAEFMQETHTKYVAQINPDDFVRWVFPKLFHARIPRYEALAEQYGYTITTEQLYAVKSEMDFTTLIETVIDEENNKLSLIHI